jgi:hypothetical protein
MRLRCALTFLALVGLLLLVPPVYASPPAPASGTFANAGPPINEEVRTAGDNIIITGTYPFIISGTVTGSAVDEVRTVFHPNGKFTFEIVETCTCTVGGQSGTMVSRLVGRGEGASYQGELIMLSGTGGLANLHYQATFVGTVGVGGSYTGQIHFDP